MSNHPLSGRGIFFLTRSNEMFKLGESDLIELAVDDLYTLVAMCWRKAGARKEFVGNWHVEAICEHLEALHNLEIRNLGISISPRKGKSLICSTLFPTWEWLRDPEHRTMNASYAEALAVRDAKRTRQLIQMEWFQERWGDRVSIDPLEEAASFYKTLQGGYRIATSVGGQSTGKGADTQIVDDPHKALEKNSRTMLEKAWVWYTETMANRYEDANTFRRLVIHQRVAENDVMGMLQKEEPDDWCFLVLPEEYIPTTVVTDIGWSDPRKYKGELLCPELLDEELAEKYKKNKAMWASQYQQDPVQEGGNYVKRDSLVRFSEYQLLQSTIVEGVDAVYTSWDTGHAGTENSDYTVGQLWVIKGDKFFLVTQERKRAELLGQVEMFERLMGRARIWENRSRRPLLHLVEDGSSGRGFVNTLEKIKHYRNFYLCRPGHNNDKVQRVMDITLYFEMRKVYCEIDGLLEDWVDEITAFPYAPHDDQCDATSQVLLYHRDNHHEMSPGSDWVMPTNEEVKQVVDNFLESDNKIGIRPSTILKLFGD